MQNLGLHALDIDLAEDRSAELGDQGVEGGHSDLDLSVPPHMPKALRIPDRGYPRA